MPAFLSPLCLWLTILAIHAFPNSNMTITRDSNTVQSRSLASHHTTNRNTYLDDVNGDLELMQAAHHISMMYDAEHPSYANKSVILPHYHSKRCAYQQPQFTVKAFMQGKYLSHSHGRAVLVQSACLGSDSIGNYLGDYFENVICSKVSGVNYITVAKVWEPRNGDRPSAFIHALPNVYRVKNENSVDLAKIEIAKYCVCPSSCHERANSLWPHGVKLIRKVMADAMNYHIEKSNMYTTLVRPQDISTMPVHSELPLIPETAIHYRCGDNFVGYYGFLPFQIIMDRIPKNTKSIYILAENRSRKTSTRTHVIGICDAILKALFDALVRAYPQTIVLVQRGGDMYLDMARLAYATTTICSVSTFCLWPAISSNGTAYFPKTKLILNGDTKISLGSNFQWITEPHTVFGEGIERMQPGRIVSMLSKKISP